MPKLPQFLTTTSLEVRVVSGSNQKEGTISLGLLALALSPIRAGVATLAPDGMGGGTASATFNPAFDTDNYTISFVGGNNVTIDTENITQTAAGWSAPYIGEGTQLSYMAALNG